MTDKKLPPLYLRSNAEFVPERRFEGDLFDRNKLAEQLTGFLSRMPDGAVIAIDSPWGEGKTWFGKRWCASLQDQGFKTAYIDCFQRDHLDDPFTMITSEFIELAKSGKPEMQTKLLDAGKKLGAALLPAATKFAVNTIGHLALGNAKLSEDLTKGLEALDASAAGALEKLVASRLLDYQASNKSIEAFKQSLAEMAAESEKPVVIFLDELDRCRPDFSVRTIERVKHFFDAPGVVFVLLLNRTQLAAAVEGLYGPKVDAEAYLSKFIPLSLILPKRTCVDRSGTDDNLTHCKSELARLGFPLTDSNNAFATMLGIYASTFGLSLRDVERAVILYSFAQPINNSCSAVAWPIAIRLHKPELYKRICDHDPDGHREARELLELIAISAPSATRTLGFFVALHRSGETRFTAALSEDFAQTLHSLADYLGPKEYVTWIFRKIDLNVEA